MVYETFLNTIKEGAAQALGDGYELSLRRIPKNNGLVLDGLCISKTGSPVAPAIYLNTCYEQYLRGGPWSAFWEKFWSSTAITRPPRVLTARTCWTLRP